LEKANATEMDIDNLEVSINNLDYSFMKRRVHFDTVDREIRHYELDEDEIASKRKGKRYL
jgi:hypothetical protein